MKSARGKRTSNFDLYPHKQTKNNNQPPFVSVIDNKKDQNLD